MDHRRWFRRLLTLLPADFRDDYAREMEQTFEAQRRDAMRERAGVLRLWAETVRDLLRTAPREHISQFAGDVRHARRVMARHPGFAVVAIVVFAAGIGATTAVFSIVRAALLSPVPFDRAGRLVAVNEITREDTRPWELSYVSYVELRRDSRSFEALAAHVRNGILIGGPEPELTNAAQISANLLETLRVQPLIGRGFLAAEDAPAGAAVALVSHEFARRRFGSAERAIDSALLVDDRTTTIVGVLPATFRFPDDEVDVWLPIGQMGSEPWMRSRAVHLAQVVGRLRDGVSIDEARAELGAWMDAVQAREPAADPGHRMLVRTLTEQVSAGARPAVSALACAALLLLVVTCSSVALLFLTRAAARSGEVAIRLSLGASRARLARQLVTEALCLTALGAIGGLVAAPVLLAFLVRGLGEALPPLVTPALDVRALVVATAAALIAALVCGLVPVAQVLKLVRSGAACQHRSHRRLVAAQVAVSCVLLVIAALLGRSLDRLLRVDPGFRADRLLVMRVNAPLSGYQQPGQLTRFYQAVIARLETLPGVAAAAATNRPPVEEGGQADLTVEGQPGRRGTLVTYRRVLPGYFATLGIPLVEGRDFTDRDDGAVEKSVIVSRTLARRLWQPGQAVGRRIKVGVPDREPWLRVVGVVGDVRNRTLEGGPDFATYEPHPQRPWNGMFVMVRTAGDPMAIVGNVRSALREIEPQVIVSDVSTMEERIEETIASRRFHATVVGAFAAATLTLVALALYGVLAFSLAARTRELGIRSAVGATPWTLTREALVEGLRPALVGLAVGMAGGAAAASASRALLFQVTPGDGWTYAGTAMLVTAVASISSWVPARRAARVDAVIALRSE
ncbi:MAG TPA: ADOP family duplicated permease [Vicinamibacterales bacterium]|nr:ADOP family duplicated permease [Vicinamibacterales bacterium]